MQEQLITFDTAKLAKENGLNIEGHKYYYDSANSILHHSVKMEMHNELGHILVIEQSLLQKWLREEYEIYIYIEPKTTVTMTPKYIRCCSAWVQFDNGKLINSHRVDGLKVNSTYEEALEKGLQEALKLIK